MRRSSGISLIETLIALLILAVALFAMAAVPLMTTRLMAGTILRNQAALYAQGRLDEYEVRGYASLPASGTALSTDIPGANAILVRSPAGTSSDIVTLTVTWKGMGGSNTSVAMQRRISDLGK